MSRVKAHLPPLTAGGGHKRPAPLSAPGKKLMRKMKVERKTTTSFDQGLRMRRMLSFPRHKKAREPSGTKGRARARVDAEFLAFFSQQRRGDSGLSDAVRGDVSERIKTTVGCKATLAKCRLRAAVDSWARTGQGCRTRRGGGRGGQTRMKIRDPHRWRGEQRRSEGQSPSASAPVQLPPAVTPHSSFPLSPRGRGML